MTLAARRFPDTITRRRRAPGERNGLGEWVPGAVTETDLRASVQPLKLEDADLEGGVRLQERLKVYIPQPHALIAAFGDREADRVLVDGAEYVTESSSTWIGNSAHTKAVLLREG